ncbi:MAG: hypothetical protein MUF87_16870 [Anaerolineae bacterium]|jgi:tetratricopeptide (TPR) repeat protein|nr:hypothetical protein [Anaerolineae bacterium]
MTHHEGRALSAEEQEAIQQRLEQVQEEIHQLKSQEVIPTTPPLQALHHAYDRVAMLRLSGRDDVQGSHAALLEALRLADQYQFSASPDILKRLYSVLVSVGQWHEALKIQERLINENDDPMDIHRRQGHYHLLRGEVSYAAEAYRRAYEASQRPGIPERAHFANAIFWAWALIPLGELEQAYELLIPAADHFREYEIHHRYNHALIGLARIAISQEDHEAAFEALKRCYRTADDRENEETIVWLSQAMVSLAFGECLLKRYDVGARSYAELAYLMFKKRQHVSFADAAFLVGRVLIQESRKDEAYPYLLEAGETWRRLELHLHLSTWKNFMDQHQL